MVSRQDCFVWKGTSSPDGYGYKRVNKKRVRLHRWAWEWANGPIPEGMHVLHKCDNPPCVNPDHLFIGTNGDNVRDCVSKGRHRNGETGKTHCKNGHPFNDDNTYIRPDGRGRACRACDANRKRKYYAAVQETDNDT